MNDDYPIVIKWDVEGDVDIFSEVDHTTMIALDLEGFTGEAAADAEASGELATYTFTATETFAGDGFSASSSYSISQVDKNQPPVAVEDKFFVEFGDSATVDVLANDFDVDTPIDPTTLMVMGGTLGTPSVVGTNVQYDANTIPFDMMDSSASDVFTYTVADTLGLPSAPGVVTAHVIDPLRETDTDAAPAAINGQNLSLTLSTEDRTFNDSSFVEVDITVGDVQPQEFNVVFIVDGSGSLSAADYATQLDAVQTTIDSLEAAFTGSPDNVEVKLIQFSRAGGSFDAIRQTVEFNLTDAALNNIAALPEIGNQIEGGTDYEPPLQAALSYFNSEPGGEQNFVFFASDGNPQLNNFADDAAALQAVANVQAFGFGTSIDQAPLDIVDSDTAVILPNVSDLEGAFATSPLFPAELVEFSLTVDGTEVADETDLMDLGGGDFAFDDVLLGLLNDLGDTNDVMATATFDTNNDGVADETRQVMTVINGTDGSDIVFA